MLKKIFTAIIFAILAYGLWFSGDFTEEFSKIAAGVAIFLFGIFFLDIGFKVFSGGPLEKILKASTNKTYKSILFGAVSATLMQSSSLVSVLTISFLSAGLISLFEGIGILLGANIGTTTGPWIAAFGMGSFSMSIIAMPLLIFGIVLHFQKSKISKGIGEIFAGLGFLFLGIDFIKEGFEIFANDIDLSKYAVSGYAGVLIFTFIGMIATVVMQSSLATIILILSALSAGQVTYENAIALVIGANIGTTFTALLGSLNSNLEGKRLALSDLIYKTLTGVVFMVFIFQITDLVNVIASFLNLEQNAFKLAIFHTLFNISGALIFTPFLAKYVDFIKKILPDKNENKISTGAIITKNIYLNKVSSEFPETAIVSLLKETKHMYENSINVLLRVLGLEKKDLSLNFNELKEKIKIYDGDIDKLYGEKIKLLFGEIMDFSSRAQAKNPQKYFEDFSIIRKANLNVVEAIKTLKHIQRNLQRFLASDNPDIKEQYEDIIFDIIAIIKDIKLLEDTDDVMDKIKIIINMEKFIENNDIINNGKVDELIRNKKITNEMATSLLKDTNYKNEICYKLISVAELVYNKDIYIEKEHKRKYDLELGNSFGISDKEVEKIVNKAEKKVDKYEKELKKTKDKAEKIKIKKKIDEQKNIIKKYQD